MYSKLQKEILLFFRTCIKWAYTKGDVNILLNFQNKNYFIDYANYEFRKYMTIKKTNFDMVKYYNIRLNFI
jgi:hypothetical protein